MSACVQERGKERKRPRWKRGRRDHSKLNAIYLRYNNSNLTHEIYISIYILIISSSGERHT